MLLIGVVACDVEFCPVSVAVSSTLYCSVFMGFGGHTLSSQRNVMTGFFESLVLCDRYCVLDISDIAVFWFWCMHIMYLPC